MEILNNVSKSLCEDDKGRLEALMRLNRVQLKYLYWSLPTPALTEITGEYDACLLDQGDRVACVVTRLCFGLNGHWIGKGFRPTSDTQGEGYNAFGSIENRTTDYLMDTYIGDSSIIPGKSFILDYRAKNRGPIRWLVGELRVLSNSIVLGIGTFGPRGSKLRRMRRTIPFTLIRSYRAYQA